ncbi:MAG: hypothetical protein RJA81_1507 [Planctomycetota bacterium]|jgi:hypothetical protein
MNEQTPQNYLSKNKSGMLALRIPFQAIFMVVGALFLFFFQFKSHLEKTRVISSGTSVQILPAETQKPIPQPKPVFVENTDKKTKPEPNQVPDEVLKQRELEISRMEDMVTPSAIRSEAQTQRALDQINKWVETRHAYQVDLLAVEASTSQAMASKAKLDVMVQKKKEIEKEIQAIAKAPKPPREALSGFSPVAKPAKGIEYHFEISKNRVSFIDLEKLLEFVKKDFQIRMRLSGSPRGIQSEVGPVGDFRLAYEIGITNDTLGSSMGFGLKGWEVIPNTEIRGETFEQAIQPLSGFQRVIRSLSPSQATITMWVYPDGFDLFRQLRDQLHSLGFMVAARPLPEGVPVRGSPSGSLSAGQ